MYYMNTKNEKSARECNFLLILEKQMKFISKNSYVKTHVRNAFEPKSMANE